MNSKDNNLNQPSTSVSIINHAASTSNDHKTQEMCIAEGCNNKAIPHQEWDNEYCSVNCCYNHCQATFQAWLVANKMINMKMNSASSSVQATSEIQQPKI